VNLYFSLTMATEKTYASVRKRLFNALYEGTVYLFDPGDYVMTDDPLPTTERWCEMCFTKRVFSTCLFVPRMSPEKPNVVAGG
jgi:hypothetical protein